MTGNAEILVEGSYHYFQNEVNYSQENFKLIQSADAKTYQLRAEILSRIETGEFLKILVNFEMNHNFIPFFARIERFLGKKYAQELFKFDLSSQELHYTFQTPEGSQEFTKSFNAKHYLTSPAFSSSALFTLSKKFDAQGRTPILLITTTNEWTYEQPPEEKLIYAEYTTRELSDFKLNNTPLSASHLCLYEVDSTQSTNEQPVEIFVSKHFGIPYQLLHKEQKIVVNNLKRNS